jgi:hypothetical protein
MTNYRHVLRQKLYACCPKTGRKAYCSYCIRCRISQKAVETQTVAAFSPGLRDDLVFRAHSSSGNLSALLLG